MCPNSVYRVNIHVGSIPITCRSCRLVWSKAPNFYSAGNVIKTTYGGDKNQDPLARRTALLCPNTPLQPKPTSLNAPFWYGDFKTPPSYACYDPVLSSTEYRRGKKSLLTQSNSLLRPLWRRSSNESEKVLRWRHNTSCLFYTHLGDLFVHRQVNIGFFFSVWNRKVICLF